MRIPVETTGMVLIAGAIEPVVNRDTGEVKADRDSGKPMYLVYVMAISAGAAKPEQFGIRVAGEPAGIGVGAVVRVRGLVAVTWEMEDRHGLSFRADAIEPAERASSASSKAT